ncbi:MAG: discoidin domain-containing protein, partial [Actinomycetota bacterium]
TLSWVDVGAAEYYVFATVDGVERYLGGHAVTSLTVAPADSYRVEHWLDGPATNAVCGNGAANLAEGRPAEQSSIAFAGAPGRAVDGNTDGVYRNGSITHTANQSQPWWQVDLGSIEVIEEIVLWNRTDCCADRLSDVRVLVSDQPFGNRTLAQLEADPAVWSISVASLAGPSIEAAVGRTGRYVRVQLAGSNVLSLAEVQVIG